jgi:hypothetical protein
MSDSDKTTWRKEISAVMREHYESWADVEGCTLDDAALDVAFDALSGRPEGEHFTLWTRARVYFPACYDGAEWVAAGPRHPCEEATEHVGG